MSEVVKSIPRPEDLWATQEDRLQAIADCGQLNGIVLKILEVLLRPGLKSRRIKLDKWPDVDQYRALRYVMREKGWAVYYSRFSRFHRRPTLVVEPYLASYENY